MLEVQDLHAYYGKSHILQGISFRVGEGEIISLLGRNGAGRSTTIKTIMGQLHPFGTIRFKGERIDGLKAHEIARRGLGYVPEDRAIFPDLTDEDILASVVQRARVTEPVHTLGGAKNMPEMFSIPNAALASTAHVYPEIVSGQAVTGVAERVLPGVFERLPQGAREAA
jgi:ABC-type branched-subunit amino acid transport system ATPase component